MQKLYAATLAAIAQATLVVADGTVSVLDWLAIAASFIGALAVYAVENTPKG